MEKPEYNHDALVAGLANIDHNIEMLEASVRQAEAQRANSEATLKGVRPELEAQRERRAEFRSLIKRHEKWERGQAGR